MCTLWVIPIQNGPLTPRACTLVSSHLGRGFNHTLTLTLRVSGGEVTRVDCGNLTLFQRRSGFRQRYPIARVS